MQESTKKRIRVLAVEDSEDDHILTMRELRRSGYEPVAERVETRDAMQQALARSEWDLIISDFILPKFSGSAALALMKESGLDLPFIILSGNIGEDIAVSCMKSGAIDLMMLV
jgi:DNA-binding NtrC family response regulator